MDKGPCGLLHKWSFVECGACIRTWMRTLVQRWRKMSEDNNRISGNFISSQQAAGSGQCHKGQSDTSEQRTATAAVDNVVYFNFWFPPFLVCWVLAAASTPLTRQPGQLQATPRASRSRRQQPRVRIKNELNLRYFLSYHLRSLSLPTSKARCKRAARNSIYTDAKAMSLRVRKIYWSEQVFNDCIVMYVWSE